MLCTINGSNSAAGYHEDLIVFSTIAVVVKTAYHGTKIETDPIDAGDRSQAHCVPQVKSILVSKKFRCGRARRTVLVTKESEVPARPSLLPFCVRLLAGKHCGNCLQENIATEGF